MGDRVGSGFRPWQIRAHQVEGYDQPAPAKKARAEKLGNAPAAAEPGDARDMVEKVTALSFEERVGAAKLRFKKTRYREAVELEGQVAVKDGALAIGEDRFALVAGHAEKLTLLSPQQELIAGLHAGLKSGSPTVISAPAGSGASHTVRWLLEAEGKRHAHKNISRLTSVDELVGSLRPNAKGAPEVRTGPLTDMVMNGGVFVADGIDQADKNVMAVLMALAAGAKEFHHPVSDRVIPVHPDFKLVLLTHKETRAPPRLLEVANLVEVTPYDAGQHVRLLETRMGLEHELAVSVAEVHDVLAAQVADSELDFGRGFALAWPQLAKVGARLAGKQPTPELVGQALFDVYGARLTTDDHRAAFTKVLADAGFAVPPEAKPVAGEDASFVLDGPAGRALPAAARALDAGEPLLLWGAGQSGVTRLVEELADRRGRELVTVLCHSGIDPLGLLERPQFFPDGHIEFKMGAINDALLHGKILYFDHVDHMPLERQAALMRLAEQKTLLVMEDGKLVEKPVHPEARIVLSATIGTHKSRTPPAPSERARVTEVRLGPPSIDDAIALLPAAMKPPELKELIAAQARALHEEDPELGLVKLQRFVDFARTTELLSAHMTPEHAIAKAAQLVFAPGGSKVVRALAKGMPEEGKPPLWAKLLGLSEKDVEQALAKTGYRLVPSMVPALLCMAVADRLRRPVLAVGPASSGKTVLGAIWAGLTERARIRQNFSRSTETRDLFGGPAPVTVGDATRFVEVPGPYVKAPVKGDVVIGDEFNLSPEAQMALKSSLDFRGRVLDPEAGQSVEIGSTFFYFAQNAVGTRGRHELPPTVEDCMFKVVVPAKTPEEKADIVASQCGLSRALVGRVSNFFADLEVLAQKPGSFPSRVNKSITCTERDMLKVARMAEYLIRRDGIADPEEQRRVLGRTLCRLLRGLILDADERKPLLEQILPKHFGDDVQPPGRPPPPRRVELTMEDGSKKTFFAIGDALLPVRQMGRDLELDKLVPAAEGLREPVGPQLEFMEDVALAIEAGQPVAVVGTTGAGKTMLMRYLAHQAQMPWYEQACHADMTEDNILGTMVLTKDGKIEFQYAPMPLAALHGGWCGIDELLTAKPEVREGALNAATEGSEIAIPERPPRVLKKKKQAPEDETWHQDFRLVFMTNGDDIRQDGFSDPEASRLWLEGIPELVRREELLQLAYRDYGRGWGPPPPPLPDLEGKSVHGSRVRAVRLVGEAQEARAPERSLLPGGGYERPEGTVENREAALAKLSALVERLAPAAYREVMKRLAARYADAEADEPELAGLPIVQDLAIDTAAEVVLADALSLFDQPADAGLRELASRLLLGAAATEAVTRVVGHLPTAAVSAALRRRAESGAITDGRITNPKEVERLIDLFTALREMQRGQKTISPLSPRVLSGYLSFYIKLRSTCSEPAAAMRAAELTLWSKLGTPMVKPAVDALVGIFGREKVDDANLPFPQVSPEGTWFGTTLVRQGKLTPREPNEQRFPMQPVANDKGELVGASRVKDLALIADAIEMGEGRPLSATDDDNGETVELFREFGALTGRPVTVIDLPRDVDIAMLIEKPALTLDPTVKGGFVPELQELAQAVRDGHILVLRGCGNIPSEKLELLNSLADSRRYIDKPISRGKPLEAHPEFRLVFMRRPGSLHKYSPAVQNRVIEPQLSTREAELTEETMERRIAELAVLINKRGGIAWDLAQRLATLHTILNQHLRLATFAWSKVVGSFLNRDAEAVATRLKWLIDHNVSDDPAELLHHLVQHVYGMRLDPPADRMLLEHISKQVLGARGDKIALAAEPSLTQHLVRFGEWAVSRDVRGVRDDVPGPEAVLPMTPSTGALHDDIFAALTFGESVHLHGDPTIARAAAMSVARLTTSRVLEVEGNEEMSEAHLFGGPVPKDGGGFDHYEGVVWRAQREGATLLIRNASRIAPKVLSKLQEIVAAGEVQRIRDGKIEVQAKNFRLFLQTSFGDPPLVPELGSLCTRVRCDTVQDHGELEGLVGHILADVPGGREIAAALTRLVRRCDDILSGEALSGRQRLAFDNARLLLAARAVAQDFARGGKLEDVIAATLTRLFIRPVGGLPIADQVREEVLAAGEQIYGASGVLTARGSDEIDLVSSPQLNDLKRDFGHVAPSFTSELLRCAAEAMTVAADQGGRSAARLIGDLLASKLVPGKVAQRLQADLEELGKGEPDTGAIGRLADYLTKQAGDETDLGATALEFVRGSRLWDLEHRLLFVERYGAVFGKLAQVGGSAAASEAGMVAILKRFRDSTAESGAKRARQQADEAFKAFGQRVGRDELVSKIFRRILEKWDLVTVSPLFKNHHQMRTELAEIQRLAAELKVIAGNGALSPDVEALASALAVAAGALEGIRVAEWAQDLKQDLDRSTADTRGTVELLRMKLEELGGLERAKGEYEELTRAAQFARRILEDGQFLSLSHDGGDVEAPTRRPEADLRREAAQVARDIVGREVAAMTADLEKQVQAATDQAAADPRAAWGRVALPTMDVGILALPDQVARPSAVEVMWAKGKDAIDAKRRQRLGEVEAEVFEKLRLQDVDRSQNVLAERAKNAANQAAARVRSTAAELRRDLTSLRDSLGLADEPELAAEIAAATQALDEATALTDNWARQMAQQVAEGMKAVGRSIMKAGRAFVRFFGGGDDAAPDADAPPPPPDLQAAKDQARRALQKVQRHIVARVARLADFAKIPEVRDTIEGLRADLMGYSNLGELAARVATLSASIDEAGSQKTKQTLVNLLNRLSTDQDQNELLHRVANFSGLVDDLSSKAAPRGGLDVEIASVLQSVIAAAQVIRSQSHAEKEHRESLAALNRAIAQLDRLAAQNGGQLPEALAEAREQAVELAELLRRGRGTQSLAMDTSWRDLMASVVKPEEERVEAASTVEVAQADEDVAQEIVERRLGEAIRSATSHRSRGSDSDVVRDTRVVPIQIDFDRPKKLGALVDKAAAEANDDEARVIQARRERIRTAGDFIAGRAKAALETFNDDRTVALEILKQLEAHAGPEALTKMSEVLEALAQALPKLSAAAQPSAGAVRLELRRLAQGLEPVAATLEALQGMPQPAVKVLRQVIAEARRVATLPSAAEAVSEATLLADRATLALRKVQGAVTEAKAAWAAPTSPDDVATLVQRLSDLVTQAADQKGRLGAWARHALAKHIAQRLEALSPALAAAERATARQVIDAANAAATRQRALVGSVEGEQAARDAFDLVFDLGEVMVSRKKLGEDATQAFDDVVGLLWRALGDEAVDGPALLGLIEQIERALVPLKLLEGRVLRTAEELEDALAGLRRDILRLEIEQKTPSFPSDLEAVLETTRAAYVELRGAGRRFLDYDPTAQAALGEISQELERAIRQALPLLVGPAAQVLGAELSQLHAGLEGLAGRGGHGGEADRLLAILEPHMGEAEKLAEVREGPERLSRLAEALTQRIAKLSARPALPGIQWLEAVAALLPPLLRAPPAVVEERLRAAEELILEGGAKTTEDAAPAEPEELAKRGKQTPQADFRSMRRGEARSAGSADLSSNWTRGAPAGRGSVPGVPGGAAAASAGPAGPAEPGVPGAPGAPVDYEARPGAKPDSSLGEIDRVDIDPTAGGAGSKGPRQVLKVASRKELDEIRKKVDEELARLKAAELGGPKEARPKNPFEQFVAENEALVNELASVLRQNPGTEIVVLVDQSGSVREAFGDTRIIDQERAAAGLVMAAVMRGESNCAVMGFDGAVFEPAKSMAVPLNNQTADLAFGKLNEGYGDTDIPLALDAAREQFSVRANNKLVLVLTDCYLRRPKVVYDHIEKMRADGYGVAVMGFGAKQNVEAVAGGFGEAVESYADAVPKAAGLLRRTIVQNDGSVQGGIDANVVGVGQSSSQDPLLGADSRGPMASSLDLGAPLASEGDPDEVFVGKGKRRDLKNLVDRGAYDRAVKRLDKVQAEVKKTQSFRECVQKVRELSIRMQRDGIIDTWRETVAMSIPREGGTEWVGKQLSGPLLDESQLPLYVMGLAQGVPFLRIFKRQVIRSEVKAKVVLMYDESSSMGDTEKARANLEALFALGDTLKALDDKIQISVIGYSDKVRLHAGFEHTWGDELKAHIMHQVQATRDATDDERGLAEGMGLLRMADAEVGMVVGFGDGQGMPGTHALLQQAAAEGFGAAFVGVGPECKAVREFGDYGIYGRNLAQVMKEWPASWLKIWENAGRVAG